MLSCSAADGAALAAQPEPWQLGFQPPATPIMERIESFHDLLLWIIILISVFVLVLLAYVCFRFRASGNAAPSRRTHNTLLEIAWTAIPVLILVVIAIPSFKLLYYEDVIPEAELTVKAIGHQWYWSYEYPDNGEFTFDAYMVADADLQPGQLRLLTTDNPLVLPVDTDIRLQITATDVLHSWAMPAFGVEDGRGAGAAQRDLVPHPGAGHLLWPVLGAVRRLSRLHADHDRGGGQGRVRGLDAAGAGAVRQAPGAVELATR